MAGYLPKPYLDFFLPRVLPKRPRRRGRRIYVTRRNARIGRRILNEEELTQALTRRGFETIAPESLSIADQIEHFYDAQLVVGPHGAGLTNLLFAERAGLIELHPAASIFPHYYLLCLALGHEYRYLCGTGADRNSDFIVDVARLEKFVDELDASAAPR
jgi:capsular polysaccharide biosynthesis protein